MVSILGISAFYHDSAAAIIVDGVWLRDNMHEYGNHGFFLPLDGNTPIGRDPVTSPFVPVGGKTTKLEFDIGDKTGTATLFPPHYIVHKVISFSKKERASIYNMKTLFF